MFQEASPFSMEKLILFLAMAFMSFFNSHVCCARPVPDTCQTKCYDNAKEIPCPQPGDPFYGQDAQHAGPSRSYTKLAEGGVMLPHTATQSEGWLLTRDNVTGLIWEMKTNDGSIHDKGNRYTWCNTTKASNGGDQGSCGYGSDTESFIASLNNSAFGGFKDWRLPTFKELSTLVNSAGRDLLSFDLFWFPYTLADYEPFYWSSTTYANYNTTAWGVVFNFSVVRSENKKNRGYVRAVRTE